MIDLVKKYQKIIYIIAIVIALLFILAIALRFSFVLFIVYAIIIIGFVVFSLIGLRQLKTYGYTGDFCKPMIWIYSLTSGTIIIVSIILLIIFS